MVSMKSRRRGAPPPEKKIEDVPSLAVPVQPLLEGSSRPYAMFKDYWKYDWVLPVYR